VIRDLLALPPSQPRLRHAAAGRHGEQRFDNLADRPVAAGTMERHLAAARKISRAALATRISACW
jgi:hypothetical protein